MGASQSYASGNLIVFIGITYFISWNIFAAINADDPNSLIDSTKTTRLMVIVMTLVIVVFFSLQGRELIVDSFVIAILLITILGIVMLTINNQPKLIRSGYSVNPLEHRFQAVLSHPNLYGSAVAVALIFAYYRITFARTTITILSIGLFLSEHRSSLFVLIFLLLTFKRAPLPQLDSSKLPIANFKLIWTKVLFVSLFASSLYIFLRPRAQTDEITTGRNLIWTSCLSLIDDTSLTNTGPEFMSRTIGNEGSSSLQAFSCHNQFLEDWLNFGLLYAILFQMFLLYLTYRTYLRRDRLVLVFLFFIIGLSFFEVPIKIWSVLKASWVWILLLSIYFSANSEKLQNRRRKWFTNI
jgi:hypothetical protein